MCKTYLFAKKNKLLVHLAIFSITKLNRGIIALINTKELST